VSGDMPEAFTQARRQSRSCLGMSAVSLVHRSPAAGRGMTSSSGRPKVMTSSTPSPTTWIWPANSAWAHIHSSRRVIMLSRSASPLPSRIACRSSGLLFSYRLSPGTRACRWSPVRTFFSAMVGFL